MAIKEQPDTAPQAMPIGVTTPDDKRPIVLDPDESEELLRSLAELPPPLSPALKTAISNYKRIKAKIAR